jgi:hypothetical protein
MERSMRRTLAKMTAQNVLIVEGRGGRGDPQRYRVNPAFLIFLETLRDWRKRQEGIERRGQGRF